MGDLLCCWLGAGEHITFSTGLPTWTDISAWARVSEQETSGIMPWEDLPHTKSLSRAGVSWRGTVFHSITNSPVEPCRVFLSILYYHWAVYPCELGFAESVQGQNEEERKGWVLCVRA